MPASRISTGHRAQRAARTGAAGIPSEWAAVVGQTADFEPDSDAELLDWMARQVTGLSAWAEALVDTYEHCTAGHRDRPAGLGHAARRRRRRGAGRRDHGRRQGQVHRALRAARASSPPTAA